MPKQERQDAQLSLGWPTWPFQIKWMFRKQYHCLVGKQRVGSGGIRKSTTKAC